MPQPRRLTLTYNVTDDTWELRDEKTGQLVRTFLTKEAATRRGVLERVLGRGGGSVVVRKKGGVFEEERRFRAR